MRDLCRAGARATRLRFPLCSRLLAPFSLSRRASFPFPRRCAPLARARAPDHEVRHWHTPRNSFVSPGSGGSLFIPADVPRWNRSIRSPGAFRWNSTNTNVDSPFADEASANPGESDVKLRIRKLCTDLWPPEHRNHSFAARCRKHESLISAKCRHSLAKSSFFRV